MEVVIIAVLVAVSLNPVICQLDIGNNVADHLLDCYNNSALPGITIANERLPANMNILIEIIRKLEDANPTMSTRQLSYHILQRLRQDGISRTDRIVDQRFGVPFSSSRPESYKFKVLVTYLLPAAEQTVNFGDVTKLEKGGLCDFSRNDLSCHKEDGLESKDQNVNYSLGTLFDYLSSTVNLMQKNVPQSEIVCLGDFNVHNSNWLRFLGSTNDARKLAECSLHYMISNTIDDLHRENEATECSRSSRYTSRINRRRRRVGEDLENTEMINQDLGLGVLTASLTRNISQCPIELGVVYSHSGTIKAGNVLAGIATGLNQENMQNGMVDNRYAATITGELCEASLYQATEDVSLGASGGWNSTINPKYFFLQSNNMLQATDAELRGALDGLYIALKMSSITSTFEDIKISQILDMYYSPYEKGVFDPSFKACNRNILYTEMTTGETMRRQLYNFMPVLNSAAISGLSLNNASFQSFSNSGVSSFEAYLPRMVSTDLACLGSSSIRRVVTDLLIFIDLSWPFETVQPVIAYILNSIDVNKFQTRYTIFDGTNMRNLTSNGTRYLSEFYTSYNQTTHSNGTTGFDFIKVFETVENYGARKLDNNSYTGGESTIILLITRTKLTDEQKSFLTQRREIINKNLPDINFLVLGSGSPDDYSAIVTNANRDVVILQDTTNEETLKNIGQQIVNNMKEVPRAIVNPSCSSQFNGVTNTFTLTGYVEPLGINYYRISPKYFYSGGEARNIKIREQGYGTINICTSRENINPDNSSSTCRNISSAEYAMDISNYCDGSSVSSCSPIYISVAGRDSSVKCNSVYCRFPDDILYTITVENVGCASDSTVAIASVLLLSLVFAISRFL